MTASSDTFVRAERSDVRRNRKALLVAGRKLLSLDPDMALYEVARSAGVGQATLYRHFPDRSALAVAVAEEIFDEIEASLNDLDMANPGALHTVIERFCAASIKSGGLYPLLRSTAEDHTDIDHLKERLVTMLGAPVRSAKKAGVVSRRFTVGDALFVIRMVTSTIRSTIEDPSDEGRTAACEKALGLVWNGVATGPRSMRPTARSAKR